MTTRVEYLGVPFDPETPQSAVSKCMSWCEGVDHSPRTVMTLNASHLCMMRRDPDLDAACRSGDLIVADGMSVVAAAKLAGVAIPVRVAGVDLMQALLVEAGHRGLRVYFLGARREVVEKLATQSPLLYPGLVVAGWRDGYFKAADHEEVARQVAAAQPHLLFIGMPSPFKETWGERFRGVLGVPVIMGVGGSFDVLAGVIRRAPVWMQNAGLEWLWRLLMEPRKLFMRYLTTNLEFIGLATVEACNRRFGRASNTKRQI